MFFQKAFSKFKLISLAVIASCLPVAVSAQITPDGTTSTEVDTKRNNTIIEQGDRVGDNLFHSFEQFSVPTGGSAGFNNATDIANIFSRVTGGSVSNIDGLLSANGTANLFLINPNGIIFGENASLNLGGSFFATSADSLLFEGDAEFSAVNPQASPLLEVNIPVGLSFRDNPGDIAVDGSALEVPNGENLSLIGGNVDITGLANGNIFAIGGKVELGGLIGAGEIEIVSDDAPGLANSSLVFPEAVARGDVTLSNFAFISVAGSNGGDIAINARNISLLGGEFGGSEISSGIVEFGSEDAQAGDIILNATDTVSLIEGNIFNQVLTDTVGSGGEIRIDTATLNIEDGGISSLLFGEGSTGKISINATDNISLTRFGSINSGIGEMGIGDTGGVEINSGSLELIDRSLIGSQNAGQGNAGDIVIDTGDFTINGRNQINTEVLDIGIGDGADINISADNITFSINDSIIADTAGQGNAGNVEINAADSVLFESGAEIRSQTLGTGDGGNVTLNTPNLTMGSGNFISTLTNGIGNAGNIEINSDNIDLTLNASIQTNSGEGSQGKAGRIDISTKNLSLTGESGRIPSISSSTTGEGDANNVNIRASDSILIDQGIIQSAVLFESLIDVIDGVGVSRLEFGVGNGGNIDISTDNLSIINGGIITTETEAIGNAGNIAINASGSVLVSNSSGVLSNVEAIIASGNAGKIDVNTANLTVENFSNINAVTSGTGNASDIVINASENLLVANQSDIVSVATASSIGDGGNVRINTQDLNVNNEGEISTSNFGQGNGGDVLVVADAVALNNGQISAANTPVEIAEGTQLTGGEIDLQAADIITLDNNSTISAEAGSSAGGGNVDIDTDIVIAFAGNNDILANAESGRGGNIDIDTQALFGIEERTINSFTNDINASSEFGLQGDIVINNPEIDPTNGLIELPQAVGDASDQISQNPCQQGIGSQFIVTGKGGLPPNPTETLNSDRISVGLVEPLSRQGDRVTRGQGDEMTRERENVVMEAVPAMGWVFDSQGEVTLTAYSTSDNKIQRAEQQYSSSCQSEILH